MPSRQSKIGQKLPALKLDKHIDLSFLTYLLKGFTEHALERHNKAKCFFTAKNISEQFRQDRIIKPEDPGYFEFENYDFESNIFTQDIHDHHDQHYDDNEETGDEKPKVCLL